MKHGNQWKGGKFFDGRYVRVRSIGHPGATYGYVREHRLVAEAALGRPLVAPELVHHVNNISTDNHTRGNLVICPDQTYHATLHRRQRALETCGHASWRKCNVCKEYAPLDDVKVYPKTGNVVHRVYCGPHRYTFHRKPRLREAGE